MINRDDYESAKANGLEERFRGAEISRRISHIVPISDQIALIQDKDDKPEKYAKYQALRAQIKAEVDAEIEYIERSLRS